MRAAERIDSWRKRGSEIAIDGRRVFYWEQGQGPVLVALHGFPASSWDWRLIADLLESHRVIAPDLFGFGLSDKSPDGDYSLFTQADMIERLLERLGVARCELVAHDMGNSVAAELLARANASELSFEVGRVVLLNGSIFIDMAQLTSGQKLFLRLPARKLIVPPPLRAFRRQISELFSPDHQPSRADLEMLEALLAHEGGHRLVPKTIRYIEERRRHQERWTAALTDFAGELALIWGELDPVAIPAMVDRLVTLRTDHPLEVIRWPDVGHWPQLEVPERVAGELKRLLKVSA